MQQEAKLLSNIAIIYSELKQYDEAVRMYQQSLLLKKELQDSLGCANIIQNLGLAYDDLGERVKATFYLSAAVNWYQMLGTNQMPCRPIWHSATFI